MPLAIDLPYKDSQTSLSQVRRQLSAASSGGMAVSASSRDLHSLVRASVYLWLSAILERFLKDSLHALLVEIEASAASTGKIRLRLFSLVCSPELQALRDLAGLKMWEKRLEILDRLDAKTAVAFGSRNLPLDGRTLREEHFRTIWSVFEFPGYCLPGNAHKLALEDVADSRNDLAHGEVDPLTMGRRKTDTEMLSLITRFDEICGYFYSTTSAYLLGGAFRRR